MADNDAMISIVLGFVAFMSLVGHGWNLYQIYQHLAAKCRPPEEREQWDANARLMVEQVYEYTLRESERIDVVLKALGDIDGAIMREDSHGDKMIYFPKDYTETLVRSLKKTWKKELKNVLPKQAAAAIAVPRISENDEDIEMGGRRMRGRDRNRNKRNRSHSHSRSRSRSRSRQRKYSSSESNSDSDES